jgi:hypothetical protein
MVPAASVTVVPIEAARGVRSSPPVRASLAWAALALATGLAASPLHSGYFDLTDWAPLALAAMLLLVVLVRASTPAVTRVGVVAFCGLAALVCLSAQSILWAESKESAWTATNRIALYAAIFAITALAVRDGRTARATAVVLGSGVLIVCLWLDCSFALGVGQRAFLGRRLNAPIGYINGTAALLAMGAWPWLAVAETNGRRVVRSAALGAAALLLATCVLTQSRAVVPATLASAVVVFLAADGRVRRAINLLIVALAVAITLPLTLAVYSTGGVAARNLPPDQSVLRPAGVVLLASAVGAGVLRQLLSMAAARLTERRRAQLTTWAGRALLAGLVVALLAGLTLAAPVVSRQWREFTALRVNQAVSTRFIDAGGYRYDLWRVALDEFRAYPLTGVGAGNYDSHYYVLRRNPTYVLQPHSLELQMLAELGVAGLAALLLFCVPVIVAAFKRRGTLASGDRMVKVAALGLFTAWLVATSVDWPYDIPGIAGLAFVAAALLVLPSPAAAPRGTGRRPAGPVVVLALVAIAFLAASVGRQYVAARMSDDGTALVSQSPAKAIGPLRLAAHLDPYSLDTLYALASAYARLDDYWSARDALLVAAAREPLNYVPPALLGDLAMRRGEYPLAVAEYQRAISLDPRDPSLTTALAAASVAGRSGAG